MINKTILMGVVLAGTVAFTSLPVEAQDGVLYRQRAGETNYCHLKFPAMQEHTLSWDQPQLKGPGSGDIIDFYGSCNYDPTGEETVAVQKRELQRQRIQDQRG